MPPTQSPMLPLSMKHREFVVPDLAHEERQPGPGGSEVFGAYTVNAIKWACRPHELPPSAEEAVDEEGEVLGA